ncbi:hypothetical protein Tco_1007138 [Tanacetum coccineum]
MSGNKLKDFDTEEKLMEVSLDISMLALKSKMYLICHVENAKGNATAERGKRAVYNQLPDSAFSIHEDSTRCSTSASNHNKRTRVYTQPRLPAGQEVTFSESAHVKSIGNTQAVHNQLPNSASLILEGMDIKEMDKIKAKTDKAGHEKERVHKSRETAKIKWYEDGYELMVEIKEGGASLESRMFISRL